MHPAQLQESLKALSLHEDEAFPLVTCLLYLGALQRNGADLVLYNDHVRDMEKALDAYCDQNPEPDTVDDILPYRLGALNAVIRDQFDYDADHDGYDNLDNINLLTVIDRRRGIPVALGALYVHLAAYKKWSAEGMRFPAHFLVRLNARGQRIIIDPYNRGESLSAGGLRQLVKQHLGPMAELHHDYYSPVSMRDIALRFTNNRKTRLIAAERYTEALQMVTHQLWFAPNEPKLYFDAGILSLKLDQMNRAIDFLTEFIGRSDDGQTIAEAKAMLVHINRMRH